MKPEDDRQRLQHLRPALEYRSRVFAALRTFFDTRDFIEVDTPLRVQTPAMELHIDAEKSGDHYLRTSPELHLKRLVAAGYEKIYQLGPCFRQGERGDLHHPEYGMLEWYRASTDYMGILDDTRSLLAALPKGAATIEMEADWPVFTVEELFVRHAGWNPLETFDADRFNLDLVDKVEPELPQGIPVVVKDYPAALCALARISPADHRVAERWELYINGVELANAYSELTDAAEQRLRFEAWGRQRKAMGKAVYPLDEEFLQALERGMPPCGGIALGVDRLVMLLAGYRRLDEVMAFRDG